MIIKVQDDSGRDKFLVEAAYIKWADTGSVDFIILEVYTIVTKAVGTVLHVGIEEEPSLRLEVNNGDRVFIMNDDGKTIDSKHIVLEQEANLGFKTKAKCERCGDTGHVSNIGGRAYTAHEPCPDCGGE